MPSPIVHVVADPQRARGTGPLLGMCGASVEGIYVHTLGSYATTSTRVCSRCRTAITTSSTDFPVPAVPLANAEHEVHE